MVSIFQVLFLVFYMASSYAVTQERTGLTAERFDSNSVGSQERQADCGAEHHLQKFPNYREAKPKIAFDGPLKDRLDTPAPLASERCFSPLIHSFESIISTQTILSRAPPRT